MAQEPRSPWSRWDYPPADVRPLGGPMPSKQFDSSAPGKSGGNYLDPSASSQQRFTEATLITKELNANDPNFYNCIYGVPNSLQQMIQECHIDVDCCEKTCCDSNWRTKYAFAVALLSLFCVIVLVCLLIWLIIWLINRARDKKQRKDFVDTEVTPQQANIVTPYATMPHHHHHHHHYSGTLNNRRY